MAAELLHVPCLFPRAEMSLCLPGLCRDPLAEHSLCITLEA